MTMGGGGHTGDGGVCDDIGHAGEGVVCDDGGGGILGMVGCVTI